MVINFFLGCSSFSGSSSRGSGRFPHLLFWFGLADPNTDQTDPSFDETNPQILPKSEQKKIQKNFFLLNFLLFFFNFSSSRILFFLFARFLLLLRSTVSRWGSSDLSSHSRSISNMSMMNSGRNAEILLQVQLQIHFYKKFIKKVQKKRSQKSSKKSPKKVQYVMTLFFNWFQTSVTLCANVLQKFFGATGLILKHGWKNLFFLKKLKKMREFEF